MVVFKTKFSHFRVKNTPLKDTNGKGKFKWMLSFLSWTEESFLVTNSSFEEFSDVFFFSRQLCKPSTSYLVCITFSNSPNPSRVYIRLWKHGKRFLLLKQSTVKASLFVKGRLGVRRMRVVELRVASNGKLTSSASACRICLFSQFKEIKRYILRLNKTLSNDHVLGPTALDRKPFSDSKFKFWKQKTWKSLPVMRAK